MKDEEMAGEYAGNISGLDINTTIMVAENKTDAYRLGIYEGFLAGLKAGRPQWHDLRKNPNDLPKNCKSEFLLCFRGGTHYGVGFFNGLRFICYGGDYDDVIAWCEIPTFDKE